MKKIYLNLLVLFFLYSNSFSQISNGGKPYSFIEKSLNNIEISEEIVEPIDLLAVEAEDIQRAKEGLLPLIGRKIDLDFSPQDNGTWTELSDGGKLWRMKITSPGAHAIIVGYNSLWLPAGSSLYLYSADKSFVIGGFSNINNRDVNFSTAMTPGESVILEYYQPQGVSGTPIIPISKIYYIYRDSGFKTQEKSFGGSGSCEINVNCSPEGDNAQDQKRGVVRITVVSPAGAAWCSGSLINNTNGDCTPYILTADHCGHNSTATNINDWVFYFNYESPDCANPSSEGSLASQTVTGATLIANGGNTGDEGSDFFLVETTDPIPDSFDPYWNGWDRSNNGASSGYSIHHPSGDIKKISHFSTALVTDGWNGSGFPSHWKVVWSTTTNGWGVTEGGSSGSPIFNDSGRIIGDLTGGGASCSNQSSPDYYGKMYYSWDQNTASTSTSGNPHIEPYLDPAGTAPMFIDGRNACTSITSNFSADITVAYKNENITFTENVTTASDPITSWAWDFGGAAATPATDNTSGPVVVTYNAVGSYTVSLDVSDGTLTDDEVKTNYITIVDSLTADYTTASFSVVTGASVDFTDASYGGKGTINTWTWTFPSGTPATSTTQNPTGIVWSTPGDYNVELCVETDSGETDCITYIVHVADPTDLQFDFIGTPTTVIVGGGVDFVSNVTANGPITTWNWAFSGANTPTSNLELPTGISWNTAGDYDVSLTAYSANDTQTVSKLLYIHVVDSSEAPVPDFIASATVINPGTTIDYTNLTTNYSLVDSSRWILAGATAPNDDIVIFEPSTVEYLNPGYYDATLIIYNSTIGNDTLTKTDYIYVLDTMNLSPCYARFRATTTRLIPQGASVSFETIDDEIGDAQYFEWTFEGGTPATFTGQVPPAIVYNSTEGAYDVALKVWNDSGASDSLNKVEYIVVVTQWPWGDPDGFCDEITNMQTGELPNAARHLITNAGEWGYFPGHNYKRVKYYAERFTNYTFDHIQDININTSRIYNASNSYNKVVFYIWNVDAVTGMPDSILGSKTQLISDFSQGITFPVHFDPAVEVNEEFYAGFKLYYPTASSGEPQDTFAVYYSGHRPNGPNTTVCSKTTTGWMTPTDMMGDTLEMSMNLSLRACLVKIDEIAEYSEQISLYPNPTSGKVTVDLGDLPFINPDLKVYDITGRLINVYTSHIYGNIYEVDFANNNAGIYMVTFDFGGVIVTKKLTLIK